MPTLILMDSSLSMLRPSSRSPENGGDNGFDHIAEPFQLMDLAKWGVDWLLSHIEKVYKLEHVAVLDYASQCDLVVPFTRDIAEVRAKVIPERFFVKLIYGTLLKFPLNQLFHNSIIQNWFDEIFLQSEQIILISRNFCR